MKRMLGVIAGVAVLAVLVGLGVVWLNGLAAERPGGQAGSPADRGAAPVVGGPPRPPSVVNVSGPRLDNSTPDNSCAILTNANATVPVQIVTVTFRHDANQLVQESAHCPDRVNDKPSPSRVCESGVTLKPSTVFADGCRIGAVPRQPGGPWDRKPARVELTLAVTCTSRAVMPCSRLAARYQPSSVEPVIAQWTVAVELFLNPGDYEEGA